MKKIAFYCTKTHPKYKEAFVIADDLNAKMLDDSDPTDRNSHLKLDSYDAVFCWFEIEALEEITNKYYLAILDKTSNYKKCIYIDYVNRIISGQKTYSFTKQDPLVKAMGLSKLQARFNENNHKTANNINILDGTAGFSKDSFALITSPLGINIKITLLEQSKAIYYLIKDALVRLGDSNKPEDIMLSAKLEIFNADLITYLANNPALAGNYDIIYLDPMFYSDTETKSRSKAKPNKNMQLLQEICSNPSNTEDLIEKSLVYAKYKVVLKRNNSEPKLLPKKINYSVETKQIRYDVYLSG